MSKSSPQGKSIKPQKSNLSAISSLSDLSVFSDAAKFENRQQLIEQYKQLVEQYQHEVDEKKRIEQETHDVMLKIASITKQDARIDELLQEVQKNNQRRSRSRMKLDKNKKK
ncbi:hypothetical protein TVAG_181570 [Trichomonas vaginalis G3]|uniref:Uncharacterized protein n=1 Tax=Trichomonas vaginalis (strain ATCC PRA-98 / G3) TaxID=412133 RepID=A2G217_TRIV3|nr:hypothetical protein TVAGG3_0570480 [Trichomonas vaginalis G3]EAX88809.1 hypothetical protein TVAG_181570 [Trichomonas vaginalis G3]KAI5521870.1 hypothetical protein TVAGG3_0570480 [Trichomonas vaginalis G3]|eukprot:XP_001301739.1 hypothetical protein [Trichomonas vaginalis G3]